MAINFDEKTYRLIAIGLDLLAGRLLTGEELKRDSVVGELTANDVFQRISKHWEEHEKYIEETYAIIKEKDVNWIV